MLQFRQKIRTPSQIQTWTMHLQMITSHMVGIAEDFATKEIFRLGANFVDGCYDCRIENIVIPSSIIFPKNGKLFCT